MNDFKQDQTVAVKQAKRTRRANLALDYVLLVILFGQQLAFPGFNFSGGVGFLILLVLLANLGVMASTNANYQRVVGHSVHRFSLRTRMLLASAVIVALAGLFYLRTGFSDTTIVFIITAVIEVPVIYLIKAKRASRENH